MLPPRGTMISLCQVHGILIVKQGLLPGTSNEKGRLFKRVKASTLSHHSYLSESSPRHVPLGLASGACISLPASVHVVFPILRINDGLKIRAHTHEQVLWHSTPKSEITNTLNISVPSCTCVLSVQSLFSVPSTASPKLEPCAIRGKYKHVQLWKTGQNGKKPRNALTFMLWALCFWTATYKDQHRNAAQGFSGPLECLH